MDEDTDFETAADHIWQGHRILMDRVREACSDEDRVILDPDPASRSGQSLRIVGFSTSCGDTITVVAVRRRYHFEVTSAWRSNARDQRIYREGLEDDE